MRKHKLLEGNVLYTIIAIILGFLAGAIVLLIAGINPGLTYGKLFDSIFGRPKYMFWSVVYAVPLIFAGLSVAFSFRTGVFNIGAEGQFIVGSLAACIVGIKVSGLPSFLHVALCMLAAAAAGAVWSMLSGLMKTKRGINEVLSFIMLNWIAFYLSNYVVNLPGIKAENKEATIDILDSAKILMPEWVLDATGCKSFNWGIVFAIIAALIVAFVINKTPRGFEYRAVGYNRNAATYAGINADSATLRAMAISGMLAGLGGAMQILGNQMRIAQFASQEGFGFQGITTALIASSNPIGCIASGLFYGAMKYGGLKLTTVGSPKEVLDIIMGVIVIFIALSHITRDLTLGWAAKKDEKKASIAGKGAQS